MKGLKKEDLENIAYDDLAHIILTENGKKMKIQVLFKKICKLLDLNEKEFEDKIADFFEMLSTDKRFIMLPNGYWDLRTNHVSKVVVEDEEEEIVIEEEPEDEDEEAIFYDTDDVEDDADDDLKDLVIISEEDTEEEL